MYTEYHHFSFLSVVYNIIHVCFSFPFVNLARALINRARNVKHVVAQLRNNIITCPQRSSIRYTLRAYAEVRAVL